MSDTIFSFFLDNQQNLYNKFPKKFILIRSEKVVKITDTYKEAFLYAVNSHMEEGTYIIQESVKDLADIAEKFYSHNVTFE